MIRAKYGLVLPDKKHVIPPMPSDLLHECSVCGNTVQPLFYRGQWRERACHCEHVQRLQRDQEALRASWLSDAIRSTYAWLPPHNGAPLITQRHPSLSQTFATFNTHRQPQEHWHSQEQALADARAFAEHFENKGNGIFTGPCGTGKSHLLHAIATFLREEKHIIARFCFATEFIEAYQRGSDEDKDRLKKIAKSTPFLILDDVDKVPETASRISIYNDIVNARNVAGLSTGLSTNVFFPQEGHRGLVQYIGEAASSRMKENATIITMTGRDQRE